MLPAVLALIALTLPPATRAAGISGRVVALPEPGIPIEAGAAGAHFTVEFLDGSNAVHVATVTADAEGAFASPDLAPGSYRVKASGTIGEPCTFLEYFTADGRHLDTFRSGALVEVRPDETTEIGTFGVSHRECPTLCVTAPLQQLDFQVYDVDDPSTPIQGLDLVFRDADSGVEAAPCLEQEGCLPVAFEDGRYRSYLGGRCWVPYRVRISDPSGSFRPAYYRQGGLAPDDFDQATTVSGLAMDAECKQQHCSFTAYVARATSEPVRRSEAPLEGISTLGLPSPIQSVSP
jgi:hypothetical protein